MQKECSDVASVQLTRVVGHSASQVVLANDRNAVFHHNLPTLCEFAVSPRSAARSTITDPGAILATISLVTSTGDDLPGITAAVITTSLSATALPSSSRWRP